jgi:hypothetical protein
MAMTKKEKAALEEALTLSALRATAGAQPDVMPPSSFSGHTSGFLFAGERGDYPKVFEAWSESVSHGRGESRLASMSGSQGARSLFSSRLLALQALRRAVEIDCCKRLRRIDAMIEKEMEGETK